MRTFLILCILTLLSLQTFASDSSTPESSSPVDLEADQLDFEEETGRYHAQGKVHLIQGDLELTGDQLWWNQLTGEVEVSGDVTFKGAEETLSGEKIIYNLQQGTGVVDNGSGHWPSQTLTLSGKRLERLGPNKFRIYDGRFTICDGERPAWSIGSTRAELTLGRYLTARHAIIYVKDVPIFYLPYFMTSIKTERESGFLMPRFGFSDRRGTEISTAWYQVLGRNMDATFSLDHLSSLGTGTGIEYRYVFDQSQRGRLKTYAIFARDGVNRGALDWQHIGQFENGLRAVVDAEYVNERDFYTDFGNVSGEYNKQKVISSVFVNRLWGKSSLTGQLKYLKDLETADPLPWQAAPHIDYSIAPLRIRQTPFYVGLQSAYTNFTRDRGTTAQRLTLRPALGVHSYLFRGLEFDSEYGYRHREYTQTEDGFGRSSGVSDFRARLASRVFRKYGGGARSWLHSIEPEASYNYSEAGKDNLPVFDRYDTSVDGNFLSYALVSRLAGKWIDSEGTEIQREVVWLRFSQSYDLLSDSLSGSDFSDLRIELVLRPTAHSSLSLDAYYDVEHERLPDFSVGAALSDDTGNSLGATYRKRRPLTGLDQVENLNFRVDLAWLKPIYLGYEQRYDFLETRLLEQVLNVDYRQQCWGLRIDLRDGENDRSIMFTLSLGGIGEVGTFGKSYDRGY